MYPIKTEKSEVERDAGGGRRPYKVTLMLPKTAQKVLIGWKAQRPRIITAGAFQTKGGRINKN